MDHMQIAGFDLSTDFGHLAQALPFARLTSSADLLYSRSFGALFFLSLFPRETAKEPSLVIIFLYGEGVLLSQSKYCKFR